MTKYTVTLAHNARMYANFTVEAATYEEAVALAREQDKNGEGVYLPDGTFGEIELVCVTTDPEGSSVSE